MELRSPQVWTSTYVRKVLLYTKLCNDDDYNTLTHTHTRTNSQVYLRFSVPTCTMIVSLRMDQLTFKSRLTQFKKVQIDKVLNYVHIGILDMTYIHIGYDVYTYWL